MLAPLGDLPAQEDMLLALGECHRTDGGAHAPATDYPAREPGRLLSTILEPPLDVLAAQGDRCNVAVLDRFQEVRIMRRPLPQWSQGQIWALLARRQDCSLLAVTALHDAGLQSALGIESQK